MASVYNCDIIVAAKGYEMKVLDHKILEQYATQIMLDEYDDDAQRDGRCLETYHTKDLDSFIHRNWVDGRALEIGCGSGNSFDFFPITHAIEPCIFKFERAKTKGCDKVDVRLALAEALPFEDKMFSTVLVIGTFHYFRSQLEGLFEINRCMKEDGVCIIDLYGGKTFPYGGITINPNGIQSILIELGFRLQEIRRMPDAIMGDKILEVTALAITKLRDTDLQYLSKMQIIPQDSGLFQINNFHSHRDQWYI